MEKNTQLPVEYNPGICNHKRPNGFTAWQMQSESSGSGPDFDEHVTICVCVLCGDINISGRKWDSKSKQTNRFNETFHVYVPEAIDAIVKQANFYNEEAKWSRIDTAYASKLQEAQQENAELRRWKMEAAELLTKIHSYAHKHLEIKLGESIVDFVIAMAKERDGLKQENADLKKKLSEWELEAYEVRGQMESLEKSAIRQNEAFEELRTSHRLMSKAYAEALIERDELKRQNDKLKEKATGWRPLLEDILKNDYISEELIQKTTKFLYGE